ncbi:capsular exopolysaccharide family [Methylomagnum ishizawai]|uniref:Capsular exopolysaccharide family n=1 Tax=Methylomagnum ishizawai TaxID=1760988 RepID=A0A1Y6DC43_9GAMM|nr:CpsD/CapB family tyrosine-protein kinase [Methylomagnum ishizawai]SMF97644.1 capsular exopolysaccharide family [Methylomagnum ishizawai]
MHEITRIQPLGPIRYTRTKTVPVNYDALREHRIVMGTYNEPRADIFRILRTHILRQLRENGWNSLAIASATPAAGKTFVAVNLAIAMALEANQSVLLVDADFRRPKVAEYLGMTVESGIVDHLESRVALENILVNPGFERLVVLPGREAREGCSELASSPEMAELIGELKTRYPARMIIFDVPPLFVADDALSLIAQVDGAVLVVEDEENTPGEIQHALHILEQTNLLGLVLNKSRQPSPRPQISYRDY